MATTFTKLRDGSWGLRGHDLVVGEWVTVEKKNGRSSRMVVGALVWKGSDGLCLCRIAEKPKTEPKSAPVEESALDW